MFEITFYWVFAWYVPVIINFLEAVGKLKHDQAPDYNGYRKLFTDELKKQGASSAKLVFSTEKAQKSAKKAPKTPTRRRKAAKEEIANDSDEENNDVVEASPELRKARTPRKAKEVKPSWRDCPTAIASNVVRAGEYVSSNPKPTKRQRK